MCRPISLENWYAQPFIAPNWLLIGYRPSGCTLSILPKFWSSRLMHELLTDDTISSDKIINFYLPRGVFSEGNLQIFHHKSTEHFGCHRYHRQVMFLKKLSPLPHPNEASGEIWTPQAKQPLGRYCFKFHRISVIIFQITCIYESLTWIIQSNSLIIPYLIDSG